MVLHCVCNRRIRSVDSLISAIPHWSALVQRIKGIISGLNDASSRRYNAFCLAGSELVQFGLFLYFSPADLLMG